MTGANGPRPTRREILVSLLILLVLATIPVWFQAWWTALPLAAGVGGLAGGRWLRWFWALPAGFGAGAVAWAVELALLPADPRTRLAAALGPAEGLSGTLFLLIGPVLFGLLAAVAGTAVAGALRLAKESRGPRAEPVDHPESGAAP